MPFARSDQTCVYSGFNNKNLASIWGRSTDDDPNQDKYGTAQFYDLDKDKWIEYPWQNEFFNGIFFRSLQYPRLIWIPGTRFLLFTGGDLGEDIVDIDDPQRYHKLILNI